MDKLELNPELFRLKLTELDSLAQEMLVRARELAASAYAPYSRFCVGAAILLDDGTIVTGSNQENAAYPSGLCAERVALFHAGSNYPGRRIKRMVIAVESEHKDPSKSYAPCGGCRQVISEYENRQDYPIEIYFEGPEGYLTYTPSVQNLLPLSFTLQQ